MAVNSGIQLDELTADAVEFDNVGKKFNSIYVQAALEEIRSETVYEIDELITSLNGTHQITVTNSYIHAVQGTATGYSVHLPDATLLFLGRRFEVINNSSETILLKDNAGTILRELISDETAIVTLETNASPAGEWIITTVSGSAKGILSYVVTSNTPFITSSAVEVLITGFAVTPVSGRYSIAYSGDITISSNNRSASCSVYTDGIQNTNTTRTVQGVGSGFRAGQATLGEITVNGSQAVDIRVSITSSNLTVGQRSIILIRLGS